MSKYVNHIVNPETPQGEKASPIQVMNDGGGYGFAVDKWTRLNRFLIMGNEGGTYYASEKKLTIENYSCILECLRENSKKTIDTIVSISDEGRAVSNAPALFALSICSVHGDEEDRAYANQNVSKVARFSTDFFTYVDNVLTLKEGKQGKGLLRSMARWYTKKDSKELAYQICKYPGRAIGGKRINHADLLRMCHPKVCEAFFPLEMMHSTVFKYAIHGVTTEEEKLSKKEVEQVTGKKQKADGLSVSDLESLRDTKIKYIWAHEKCRHETDIKKVVSLIEEYNLTRESVSPSLRENVNVQRALLKNMPMTALIRNLGSMTASGLLKPLCEDTSLVIDKITSEEAIKRARIHPMTIMKAIKVYSSGIGGKIEWTPVLSIKDALEEAFYKAFNYVEPTGKRFLFGIDVSGSMASVSYSDPHSITPREAAAIIAMTCARTEKNYECMGFSHDFVPLGIKPKDSLEDVISKISMRDFGATDCSLPILYATENNLNVDVFVILTDNQANYGKIHPFEALKKYRKSINKNAKMAVLSFENSLHSIADPTDAGMIDVSGTDSNIPIILSEFAVGRI